MIFDDTPVKIDLKKLSELFDPFECNIWVKLSSPITKEEIAEYLQKEKLQSPDVSVEFDMIWDISDRDTHIKRIAWFVKNYDSEKYPIVIDFGIPNLNIGYFEISDGNHRLMASLYRGDEFVYSGCSGAVEEIEKYTYQN